MDDFLGQQLRQSSTYTSSQYSKTVPYSESELVAKAEVSHDGRVSRKQKVELYMI